jgi:hypothetical protein
VDGEPYTLWLYVPDGVTVSQAKATSENHREITVQQQSAGKSLQITFEGQPEAVNWEVAFAADSGH